MFYTTHRNLKDEDNEIEEEEINAALKRVLILLDQVNLQNKLLNIAVLFIWYLLASLKKMSLTKHFGEY
jgi:hypothetical protein